MSATSAVHTADETAKGGAEPAPQTRTATVVVDTSALLNDPGLLDDLSDREVVVPLPVVVELDRHKRDSGDRGYAAREALRRLDAIRYRGNLGDGVATGRGGRVRVLRPDDTPQGLDERLADHEIAAVALALQADGEAVELLTDDAGLRVIASYVGLEARHHEPPKRDKEGAHPSGWVTLAVPDADINRVWEAERGAGLTDIAEKIPHPNGYAVLQAVDSRRVARVRRRGDLVTPIGDLPDACGITPRDVVQAFALDALAGLDVPMVALTGAAGSGKTLLAIATGLAMYARGEVESVTVLRPITPVDRQDLGHLPGELDEKLAPWMGAIEDVVKALPRLPVGRGRNPMDAMVREGVLRMMSVTHLRGRTVNGFVVLDEAQNLSVRGVRTVATRIGEGSKLAVVGDPNQIDDPYLTAKTNGLTRLLEGFAGQRLFAHLHLESVQRSDLAAVASELL